MRYRRRRRAETDTRRRPYSRQPHSIAFGLGSEVCQGGPDILTAAVIDIPVTKPQSDAAQAAS